MKTKKKTRFPLPELYIILLLLLFYLPILVVVVFSFNDSKLFQWSGFTFSWYEKLMRNQTIWQSFATSLQLALLSCGASAVLGALGAVGMAGRQFKTKGLLENVSLIPIMVPEIILGMAYLTVFTLFRIPFGMVTMVIAHTTFCVPYIFINVKARLTGLDPSIGEAALDLGASSRRMFLDITLPLILPAVASGALLAFAMSMDDVVISFFTNGPNTNTLPLQVYSMMKMGVTPEINALCTVMLGAVFLIVALSRLFRVRRKRS
ncbi:MAG: ABC transporter permease [Clostridiales bacterium]|jgi:spermidine/putrescine transport system permease protein|nr:ABC transporter permease [Clostridiales bacterium]